MSSCVNLKRRCVFISSSSSMINSFRNKIIDDDSFFKYISNISKTRVNKYCIGDNVDKLYFLDGMEFYSYDGFINNEVNLFWTLLGEGINPDLINYNASLYFLTKKVEEARMMYGYFLGVNSKDIFIARKILDIMLSSSRSFITLDEAFSRFRRYKINNSKDYTKDIKYVIDSYRDYLKKNGFIDSSMIYECFMDLFSKERYIDEIKNIDFYVIKPSSDYGVSGLLDKSSDVVKKSSDAVKKSSDAVKKSSDAVKKSSDVVRKSSDDIGFVVEKVDVVLKNSYKIDFEMIKRKLEDSDLSNIDIDVNVFSDYSNTYFEMMNSLERVLADKSIDITSKKPIVVCVPRVNTDIISFSEKINKKYGIDSCVLGSSHRFGLNYMLVSSVVSYRLLYKFYVLDKLENVDIIDIESFILEENLVDSCVELVKFIDDAISNFFVESNIESSQSTDYNSITDYNSSIDYNSSTGCNHNNDYNLNTNRDSRSGVRLNYYSIRKNLPMFIKKIIDCDEFIIVSRMKNCRDFDDVIDFSEFVKLFYKSFSNVNEVGMMLVSQICDVFDSIKKSHKYVEDAYSLQMDIMDFLLSYVSEYEPTRRIAEKYRFKDVLFVPFNKFINSPFSCSRLVILDCSSKGYDIRFEGEFDTKIGYYDADRLKVLERNYSSRNDVMLSFNDFLYDYVSLEKKRIYVESILKSISKVSDSIFVFGSFLSINGFDQENEFENILKEVLDISF